MKITRAAEYAVRCIYYLAWKGEGVVVNKKKIAEQMNIPEQFLTKVAQQLAHAGIIIIVQGAKGGFMLTEAPEKITLLDIIEVMMGTLFLNDCIRHPESCKKSPDCSIHVVWQTVQQKLRETLKEANFKNLLNNKSCMNNFFESETVKEKEIMMSKTQENLQEAFAGESQANRKYLAFAQKADKENFPHIAKLFRAAAEAETVHAHAHLKALKAVKNTVENLQEAIAGETHEFKHMYPKMIETAKEEKHKAAERSFSFANEVEQIHAELYQKALDNLDQPQDVDCYYVCSVCGYTCENEAPDNCPVCNAKSKAFLRVE